MTGPDSDLGFLLTNLVQRVPGIREAAVVSSDGLLIALSAYVDRETGDRLAAVAAGLLSVARGAGVPMPPARCTRSSSSSSTRSSW